MFVSYSENPCSIFVETIDKEHQGTGRPHLAASASRCIVPGSCREGPVSHGPHSALMAEASDLPAKRREQAELQQLMKLPATRRRQVQCSCGHDPGCPGWEMGIEARTAALQGIWSPHRFSLLLRLHSACVSGFADLGPLTQLAANTGNIEASGSA